MQTAITSSAWNLEEGRRLRAEVRERHKHHLGNSSPRQAQDVEQDLHTKVKDHPRWRELVAEGPKNPALAPSATQETFADASWSESESEREETQLQDYDDDRLFGPAYVSVTLSFRMPVREEKMMH